MFFKRKWFNNTYLPILFFLIVSLLLVLSWFKAGHFYGGGDVGLPTYNPQRVFQMAKYIWWEAIAPGFPLPHVITSVTLYFFLSLFQFLGFGPVVIQAILFFSLLFLMGFGTYLLTLSIIGQDKKTYATIAGVFYMFNPYMLTQIWHRFVFTSFLFVAALPFLILFWRLWIKNGSYLYLLIFLMVNILASYMFGTIAFVFPLWLILSLFTISEISIPWRNKSYLIKILWRFTLGLIFWIFLNSWWLIPVLTVSQGIASQQHNIRESIFTLIVISKQAILPYSLQMGNSFYLFDKAELGEVYKSFFFRLIPWLGVVTIFFGIVCALRKKYLAFIPLVYLIVIMLSKGTSSPFGQPFLLTFSNFFALGLLRNPFEKIGILLPLVSSILFVLGIEGFFNWSNKILSKTGKKIILIIWLMIMAIYYWPMYQGTMFGKIGQPNYVEIPQSYTDVDKRLSEKVHQESEIDGKILHLPLTRSDVITYNWKYGYHGIESSASLFTSLPSISRGLNLHSVDDSLTALSMVFNKPYNLNQEKILKLLQDFNVRFIVLHKDLDWLGSDAADPLEVEKVLKDITFIKKEAEFGDLVIYMVKDEFFASKIEINNNIALVYPQKVNIRIWPWLVSQKEKNFISPLKDDLDNNLKSSTDETFIFPDPPFSYPEASASSLELTERQLTAQLNTLLGTVQYLKQLGIIHTETEGIVQKIVLASRKLIDIYLTSRGVDEYSNLLNNVFPNFDDDSTFYFDITKTTIIDLLKLHEITLSAMGNELEGSEEVKISELNNKIKQFLAKEKSYPLYLYQGKVSEVGQKQYYDFRVNTDGKYELLLTNSKMKDAYTDKLSNVDFQINNERVTLSSREIDNIISFGKIDLKQGLNEISFGNPPSVNLISSLDSLVKIGNVKIRDGTVEMSVSKNSPSAVESPVLHTVGEDIFQISFDAVIPANIGLYIQVIQDMDAEQNGKKIPRVSFLQHLNQSDWQGNYNIKLPSVSLPTREAKVRLIALIPQEVTGLNIVSAVTIKNLKLIRVLNDQIFLKDKTEKDIPGLISGQILKMKQKNPVLYEGKIKIERPTFLIFKEAFHSGWTLELTRNNKSYRVDKHYLANLYANAWQIEDVGEYDFKIEFEPQRKVTLGFNLALAGLTVISTLIFISRIKQKYGRS